MDKKILTGVIVCIAIISIAAFMTMGSITGNVSDVKQTKEFNIKAFQFGYEPNTITVNNGDVVKINIENTDVPHGIRIPDFNVKGENSVEFTVNKTGEFKWYCTIFCGDGHRSMNGTLIVK
ncbi:MAG: cupredoxin domain-containing protein [Candidatus Aenigmatarchaeota archaeon]